MSKMREFWSDPAFLAGITKMQPAGVAAEDGAPVETGREANGSAPPGGPPESDALVLNGAGAEDPSDAAPFAAASPVGNGTEEQSPMIPGMVRYEAASGKGRGKGRGNGPGDDDDDDTKSKRISTPNKRRLEDLPLLKKLVPDKGRRKQFGDWLKKNHKQGETGEESDPGRGGGGQDGHDHLDDELEDMVRQWQDEEGHMPEEEKSIREKRDGETQPKKRSGEGESEGQEPTNEEGEAAGGTGGPDGKTGEGGNPAEGQGPHDGAKQSEGKGTSGGSPPAQGETGPSPAVQQAVNKIDDFVARMQKFQQQWADLEKRQDALDDRLAKQKEGEGDPKDQAEAEKLSKEAAGKQKEAEALQAEGEDLGKQVYEAAPQELEQAFGAKDPNTMLEAARNGAPRGLPQGEGFAARAAGKLASAYFWVVSIDSILESDNKLEAIVQVGANYAVGSIEGKIFEAVIGESTPVTLILGMVVGMCGDQAGACEAEEAQELAQLQKDAEASGSYRNRGRLFGALGCGPCRRRQRWRGHRRGL